MCSEVFLKFRRSSVASGPQDEFLCYSATLCRSALTQYWCSRQSI
jgi:hypothetical protein